VISSPTTEKIVNIKIRHKLITAISDPSNGLPGLMPAEIKVLKTPAVKPNSAAPIIRCFNSAPAAPRCQVSEVRKQMIEVRGLMADDKGQMKDNRGA